MQSISPLMPTAAPDGISPKAALPEARHANPLSLVLLATLIVAGVAGFLGGHPPVTRTAQSESVELKVSTPERLRNGMVFETLVEVRADRAIKKLVVGVSDSLWREMTINTMIPAAHSEEYADGFHRFAFADLKAGETFRFKIDGQINPPLLRTAHGEVIAFDGEQRLAGVTVRTWVLP